jgi:hypothetical protein
MAAMRMWTMRVENGENSELMNVPQENFSIMLYRCMGMYI